jgi:catechol 2,3-dioxygenase-like lactoylglutathione lyase family enzyme
MLQSKPRLLGIELYFDDLEKAKQFYCDTLGLDVVDEQAGHHAKFDTGATFVCLERIGAESYPSRDKAVVFLEVADLQATVDALGPERIVQCNKEPGTSRIRWAVLHDPEGHNVLLLPAGGG